MSLFVHIYTCNLWDQLAETAMWYLTRLVLVLKICCDCSSITGAGVLMIKLHMQGADWWPLCILCTKAGMSGRWGISLESDLFDFISPWESPLTHVLFCVFFTILHRYFDWIPASDTPRNWRKKLNARMKSFSLDTPDSPKQLLGIDETTKKKSHSFTNTCVPGIE